MLRITLPGLCLAFALPTMAQTILIPDTNLRLWLNYAKPNSVDVNGYCDIKGTERYNQALSERRAAAVVRYLVKAGIPASQLEPHGYGKTNFVATNDTAEGRAQNRRVELVPKQ